MRAALPFLLLPLLAACAADNTARRPVANIEDTLTPADIETEILPIDGQPRINQSFVGSVPMFGRTFPLPPGTWTVIAARSQVGRGAGVLWGSLALIQRDATGLRGMVEIAGSVHPLANGRATGYACATSDVLWNDIRQSIPHGPQDCALIMFERPALWRDNNHGIESQIMDQLDALGIQSPNILVEAGIYEASTTSDLSIWVYRNPDLEGIPPDLSTQRAKSSWTAFNVPHDPAKLRLIESLKAEIEPLRAAMRKSIDAPAPFVPGSGLTPA